MKNMELIIAGFGGQGILSAGTIMAFAGMYEDLNVSWLPSYGPEKRGGTANCHVVLSEDEVGSPIINSADALIAMNNPSYEKFSSMVKKGGIIFLDSSFSDMDIAGGDARAVRIPVTRLATEMGNKTYAVIILLGALIAETGIVKKESIVRALYEVLPQKYHHMIPDEIKALELGMTWGR